jgi:hypothetical protein
MKDMYTVLAAQWGISRDAAKARIFGSMSGDPTDDLTDTGMETLRAVVKTAIRRRDAETRLNHHA